MDLTEYRIVQNYTYLEYCDYLQNKYGIGACDYMTPNWTRKRMVSRTKEGLLVHHKFEDHAPNLSVKECAINFPYEWQHQQNLVYCNYLEHLFLHILICEYPAEERIVGIRGILRYIVPELNDFYSGAEDEPEWKKQCFEVVKYNKDTYLALLKRFKTNCNTMQEYHPNCLCVSCSAARFEKDYPLFEEIKAL